MRNVFAVLVSVMIVAAPLVGQSAHPEAATASITELDVAQRIGVLAHDSMEGRATPSRGLDRAALYILNEFQRMGLEPGGDDGAFVQRFYLAERELDVDGSHVSVGGGPTWLLGEEVLRFTGETGDEPVTGSPVVVSGLVENSADLDEMPIEGAIVLLVAPMNEEGGFAGGFSQMLSLVRAREPAALVMVTRLPAAAWEARRERMRGSGLATTWRDESRAPVLYLQDETIGPVLEQAGFDLAAARASEEASGVVVSGIELSVQVRFRTSREIGAPNIVGVLRGSDPELANEYVVLSAHMDHVGTRRPVDGDSIYNGADDNASGTAGVLELAEAFAQAPERTRRSLIFLLVSGEERGLWGSDYFATRPPVPIEQIVADLNMDMIGRNWPDTIAVIGMEHSDLGETVRRVSEHHPELNMAVIDDPWPEERIYFRSDHYNFARRGVPILFFTSGMHEDYHGRSDHADKINADKEARLLKLIFHVTRHVADADERPIWNPESYDAIVGR